MPDTYPKPDTSLVRSAGRRPTPAQQPTPAQSPSPVRRSLARQRRASSAADVRPDTSLASAASSSVISGISPARTAEIVRLHDARMGIDALGARFRLPYAVIRRIVERELARRAANAGAAAREYEGW